MPPAREAAGHRTALQIQHGPETARYRERTPGSAAMPHPATR